MSGIAGLRGTGDFGTDERPKSFRELIAWRNPNGSAPIFALTSKAKKKTVTDPEFAWWDEPNDLVRLEVNGTLAAADTLVTVDSADPTDAAPERVWGTATHLKPGDLLFVEGAADDSAFTNEVIEVVSVLSDTQFTVMRGVAGTTAATITDNWFLTLIGSAYAEGTGVPRSVARNPIKYKNYTQIFKDTYEITGTLDETEIRTGDAWSNDKKRKMFKHAMDIEMALMLGRAFETTGTNGKPKRYMGGLRDYIPNKVYTAAVTMNTLLDDIGPVFDFETGAGDTRIMFLGRTAAMELNKIVVATTNVRMELGNTVTVYGQRFRELLLTDGRILMKTHPLLSRHGKFKKSALILDFDSINYVALRNRDTKAKDDVQSKDEDVRRGFWMSECSLMVERGGLTMKYLGNISAT